MDSLDLFTFLWAQVASLQLVKLWLEGELVWFCFLGGAVAVSLISPRYGTIPLMLAEGLTLIVTGSQSNHVLVSMFVCVSVLTSWKPSRVEWTERFVGAIRLLTAGLYLITGIHKLNEGWFDIKYSCACQMLTGSLAVLPFIPDQLVPVALSAIPYLAASIEVSLGGIFLLGRGDVLKRFAAVSGALMHLIMALPLSPMSVYPFSILMVPLYVCLVPERITPTAEIIASRPWLGFSCVTGVSALAISLKRVLGVGGEMLEYPAYSSWSIGVSWNICMWLFVIASCCIGRRRAQGYRYCLSGWLTAVSLFVVGMLPFLGLRTYTSLAMFSNLRTEGGANNHFIFGRGLDLFGYQSDIAEILRSDILTVRDMQVDLGLFFDSQTKELLNKHGMSTEFYIVPPKWTHVKQMPFKPFAVPFVELQRRISTNRQPGYVEYLRGDVIRLYNSTTGDEELDTQLGWLESHVLRFRTFDRAYSPCRH